MTQTMNETKNIKTLLNTDIKQLRTLSKKLNKIDNLVKFY